MLIRQVITRQASVQRCNATIIFDTDEKQPLIPVTVNHKDLHKHFRNVAENMLGSKNVIERQPLMGAEDFSFYQEVVPGYFFFVGMKDETKGALKSGHSPSYTVNEDVLPYGAALHAALAARYLSENHTKSVFPEASSHDEL